MKKTKIDKRLEQRQRDFDRGPQGASQDQQKSRWTAGGYHRPGSRKHRG